MQRIKKGDTVQIISGNEVGVRGEVERLVHHWRVDNKRKRIGRDSNATKIVVRGVNVRKKHQRRTGQTRTQTGIIEIEAPIHISNVMLVCPNCTEAARVGFNYEGDKKVRFCKRCEAAIDKV